MCKNVQCTHTCRYWNVGIKLLLSMLAVFAHRFLSHAILIRFALFANHSSFKFKHFLWVSRTPLTFFSQKEKCGLIGISRMRVAHSWAKSISQHSSGWRTNKKSVELNRHVSLYQWTKRWKKATTKPTAAAATKPWINAIYEVGAKTSVQQSEMKLTYALQTTVSVWMVDGEWNME